MKIVKLVSENIKRLKAVEITPSGALVEISGRNGSGKTSILDSIFWAIAGAKHIQAVPIRKGQDRARIKLDLGELVVERKFTATGSTLTVESAVGARYKSPQAILDALVGALAFDPLAFLSMEPRAQFDALKGLVQLEIDPDQLDGLNRRDYDTRTEANREARSFRAQAEGVRVPDGLPDARVDTSALMDRLTAASTENAALEKRRAERDRAVRDMAGAIQEQQRLAAAKRSMIEKLERDLALLRADADGVVWDIERLEGDQATMTEFHQADPLPEPVDATAIRAELTAAETINKGIDQRERRLAMETGAKALEDRSKALTEAIAAREQTKADAIAKAEMPVPGLGFGDGLVTLDGLPFEQASTAQQLRVSIAIAMAANPRLRVLRIKEGSLLDPENFALLGELAQERDYQVWVETTRTDGRAAILIDDGQIVTAASAPAQAELPTS